MVKRNAPPHRNQPNFSMVFGVFHSIPGYYTEKGKWVENPAFFNAAKRQIDRTAARGGKVLFAEVCPEDLVVFRELRKMTAHFPRPYRPPTRIPQKNRDFLTSTYKLLLTPRGFGEISIRSTFDRFIRNNVLEETHRFWLDTIEYAKRKGFEIVPIARYDLLDRAGSLGEKKEELEKAGKKKEAEACRIEEKMAEIEFEHFMKLEVKKLVEKGIHPDLSLVGRSHSDEIELALKQKGIRTKRKETSPKIHKKTAKFDFKLVRNQRNLLRELYQQTRKAELQRIANALNKARKKKANAQRKITRKPQKRKTK